MSYFASQLPGAYDPPQLAWTSVYIMDATGDYIEWDFTLTSAEAERANTGYVLWSGRVNCEQNADGTGGAAQMTVNGVPVGGISFLSGLSWTRPLAESNATWETADTGGFRVFYGGSQNIYQAGSNTVRVQLIPYRNPVVYDVTFPDPYSLGHALPYGIEFIAAEFEPLENFGKGRLISDNSNYPLVDATYGVFPGFPAVLPRPPWLSTHSNPTYDHTQVDQYSQNLPTPVPQQSGSLPTFLFLATDGRTGHADLVDMTITGVRKTSSSFPVLASPLTMEYDVTVSAGAGDIILLGNIPFTTTNGDSGILDAVVDRQSGPSATVTLSQDLFPPSNIAGDPTGGSFGLAGAFIIYGGDASTLQPDKAPLINYVVSPFLAPEPTFNTRYNVTWTAVGNGSSDIFDFGPILVNVFFFDGVVYPDAYPYTNLFGEGITAVIYEQVPVTYSWDSDGVIASGTGFPAPFTHEYPHHFATWPCSLTTTGRFQNVSITYPRPGYGIYHQTNAVTNSVNIAWFSGWLHFTSPALADALFEPFTDQPLDENEFTIVEATDTDGYVEWNSAFPPDVGIDGFPVIVGYPPSGGARVSTSYLNPSLVDSNVSWCFAVDQSHIWVIEQTQVDPFNVNVAYGPIGGPYVVKVDTGGDPFRSVGGIYDLKVDMSTGLLYVLWKSVYDLSFFQAPFIDQIDPDTGAILKTYYPTDVDQPFLDTGAFNGMIAVSNGVLYFTGFRDGFPPPVPPIDRIWRIDTVTGAGAAAHAFTAGTGQLITGLTGGGDSQNLPVPAVAKSVSVTAVKQNAIGVGKVSAVSS